MSEVHEDTQVKDHSTSHKYRTEHPNILYEIGLDPYEFILYSFYKKIAGDEGNCIISNKKLAALCKMSLRTLISRKANLVEKKLIKVTDRKNADGTDTTSLVEIMDIWNENYSVLSQRYSKNDSGVHVMHGGVSTDAHHKEEPLKNHDNDSDIESDDGKDENQIKFIEKSSKDHKSINEEKIRTHLKVYDESIISAVIKSLKDKTREVTCILAYAKTSAENQKEKGRKKHGSNKRRVSSKGSPKQEGDKASGDIQHTDGEHNLRERRSHVNIFTPDVLRDLRPGQLSTVS